jgi:hypothetical protein
MFTTSVMYSEMLIPSIVLILHMRKLRHKGAQRLLRITQSRAKPGTKPKLHTPLHSPSHKR